MVKQLWWKNEQSSFLTKMRIGIDARFYRVHAGIGRYLRNLLENLQKIDSKNNYYIFLLDEDYHKVSFQKNFQKVRADFTWYGWEEQLKFPKVLGKQNLDLVHFPHFNVPIFYKGKFVVTIHDLIHQKFQMKRVTTHNLLTYKFKQFAYQRAFSFAVRKSQRVITVSDYVRKELINQWKVPKGKIIVTLESVEQKFIELAKKIREEEIKTVLEKFGVRQPFIYYIGNAHPHKNIEGLVKAFLLLRKNYQYLTLVLAGHDNYFWERIKKEYQDKNIIYTGFVSDEESIALLKTATVYVQPSLEEGFGIPLLEAFACGCPVVSSQAASLPEVGGDAALYFDPNDIDDMALKIGLALNDNKFRRELINKGQKKIKQYSWQKLAQDTLKVYSSSF